MSKYLIILIGCLFILIISGILIWQLWSGGETPSPTPTPPINETADWQIYTNQEFGYEIKYPTDWVLEEVNYYHEYWNEQIRYLIFHSPSNKYFLTFGLKGKEENIALSDRSGVGAGDFAIYGIVKINGVDIKISQLLNPDDGKAVEIYYSDSDGLGPGEFEMGNYYIDSEFLCDLGPCIDITNTTEFNIANKILSTFKFIDANNETTNWQTYRNEEYGFEIKYPKDFSLDERNSSGLLIGNSTNSVETVYFFDIFSKEKSLTLHDYIIKKQYNPEMNPYYERPEYQDLTKIGWNFRRDAGDIEIWSEGFKETLGGFESQSYLSNLSHPELVISASFNTDGINQAEAEKEYIIFNQILSTFKFID